VGCFLMEKVVKTRHLTENEMVSTDEATFFF